MKIAAVEAANDLLRSAVVEPSIGNLAAMETLWQGQALAKVQAFAQDLSQGFRRPLDVTFVYLTPPLVLEGVTSGTTLVTSTEVWTYTRPSVTHSETFKFTYTLGWQDDGWVIIDYAYGYAPGFPPPSKEDTPTPSPTLTATPPVAQ
jgi:hypothetical protein